MTAEHLSLLANLGAGALLGWLALPLFARITVVRFAHEPSSSHRALLWALVLAALFMLVPWARALIPHSRAVAVIGSAPPTTLGSGATTHSGSALGFYLLCLVGAAWSIAAALDGALALVSLAHLTSSIRRARTAPEIVRRAVARCTAAGVDQIRRVLVSDEASVPFVAVPWSPTLVVPAAFHEVFDDRALALMIEHEATHLDRRDLWTSALVRTLCVLFPFHPAAARLANDIAFAREASVDARVSARDPHGYASLLVDVAANARFDQQPRPVSMDDTSLKRRIAMLTDEATSRRFSITPLIITAAGMGIVSLLAPSVFAAAPDALLRAPHPELEGAFRTATHTPESSYEACQAKSEGDHCPFPTPDGDLQGVCTLNRSNERLFCAPPPPPGAPAPATRGRSQ